MEHSSDAGNAHKCQMNADKINAPTAPLSLANKTKKEGCPMALLYVGNGWPYLPLQWAFLIFSIYYLTKWVEAVSYSSLTKKVVQKFLNKERICRSRLHSLPLIERRKNGTGSSERNESKGKG